MFIEMKIEMLLLIPEMIICVIDVLLILFGTNADQEKIKKMDMENLAKRLNLLSMSKEKRKWFIGATTVHLIITLVLTVLVAIGVIFLTKRTMLYVFICIVLQICISIFCYINWCKRVRDKQL